MHPSKKQKRKDLHQKNSASHKKSGSGNIQKHKRFYSAVIVAAISFLLYANTLNHGYVLDDYSVIKENWVVKQGLDGIGTIFKTSYRYGYWNDQGTLYRPLSLVMFAVEWHFFPGKPFIGHFLNVALYAFTILILFLILKKLFASYHSFIPFAIALLFAAHPLHTEVVANIKSRDEILCFLFALVSVYLLIRYIETGKQNRLLLSLFSYFLSFLSKESAIVYLALFPLILYFFFNIPVKKIFFLSALFISPAVVYLLMRHAVLGSVGGIEKVDIVDNLLAAAPDKAHQLATAILILGKYTLLLLYPHPLSCDYSYNQIPIVGFNNAGTFISLLMYSAITGYALFRLKKKDIFSFALLFFLITLSIYSNIFMQIGSSFGERFLYQPSLGFLMALFFLLSLIFKIPGTEEIPANPSFFPKNTFYTAFVFLIFTAYSFKTISRNKDWESNYSLYAKDVITCPNSARTHYYYALELVQSKALKMENSQQKTEWLNRAITEFTSAAEIYPPYPDAYDQRGLAYYRMGMTDKAMESYELALKYSPLKSTTLSNMGAIYFGKGNYQKALECYQRAVDANPRYADAYWNLGSTFATLGRYKEAVDSYLQSLKYDNENAMVYYYLGITYPKIGDNASAQKYLDIAYRMKPELKGMQTGK